MTDRSVKSARRVIEVFEYFAERRAPATLTDIARALGSPPSSAFALLATLRQLGYLDYDRHRRTFLPTLRAALLGIWVNDLFLSDGTILRLMDTLRERSGETVVMGTQSGLHVQYIHVLRSLVRRPSREVATGRLRPLLRSAVGQIILSTKSDDEILAIARRINAAETDPEKYVRPADLLQSIERCRRGGFGYTEGATTPGAGIIAVLLNSPRHQPPTAIGIGTVIPKLREKKRAYLEALREAVETHSRIRGHFADL